jgi:hypothetical protein
VYDFVAGNISPGDPEVVFQHGLMILHQKRPIICQPANSLSINTRNGEAL